MRYFPLKESPTILTQNGENTVSVYLWTDAHLERGCLEVLLTDVFRFGLFLSGGASVPQGTATTLTGNIKNKMEYHHTCVLHQFLPMRKKNKTKESASIQAASLQVP